MQTSPQNWQQIIWQEWRHCQDTEYGQRLFEIVAGERVGPGAKLSLILFDAIAGASLGILLIAPFTLQWWIIQQFALAGFLLGAARGYVVGRTMVWQDWLQRLESNSPGSSPGRLMGGVVLLGGCGFMIFGPIFWLEMLGLFWVMGGVITWLNRSLDKGDKFNPEDRRWWFWWHTRPHLFLVKTALEQASTTSTLAREVWAGALQRLAVREHQPASADDLIRALLHKDWAERFIVRYMLVDLGREAVAPLQAVAKTDQTPLRDTILWLLRNIEVKPLSKIYESTGIQGR